MKTDIQIEYWAEWYKQLAGLCDNYLQLNESYSKILNSCVKAFGENITYGDNSFCLTKNNCLKIFNILDKHLFGAKLKNINTLSLFVGSTSELNKIILDYTRGIAIDTDGYLALYQPDFKQITDVNGLNLTIKKDAIFINIGSYKTASCAYILAAVCHEMIHAYDAHFGQLLQVTNTLIKHRTSSDDISYMSHFTPIFKQKSTDMKNDTNITIPITGNDIDFNELCKQAAAEIQVVNENEIQDGIPYKFPKKIVDRYKNSDTIFFSKDRTSVSIIFGQLKPKTKS